MTANGGDGVGAHQAGGHGHLGKFTAERTPWTHRMLSEGGTAGLPRSESEAHEGEREESYAQEMRRGSDNYLPAFLPSLSSLPLPLMNNQSCDKRFPK